MSERQSQPEELAMSWSYAQGTGRLSHDGELIATGYSGNGTGLNNPGQESVPFVGPLPRGSYTIGPPIADGGHLGPYVMALTPGPANNMFGRAGFFVHGDNQAMNSTASNGCIVLARQWRTLIATSGDTLLVVTT
jgi:hypothetical protein